MTAIVILGSGVAVAASRPHRAAAAGLAGTASAGAPCKLTAAPPTVAKDHITGKGSIRCTTSRSLHVHIETQTRQLGHWSAFGSFDGYARVRAGKTQQVSTGPANCRGLGTVTMRTAVRLVSLRNFRHVLVSVHSRTVTISCSGGSHVPSVTPCDVTAQAPSYANNEIDGSSGLTCASDRHDIVWTTTLEVEVNGQWQQRGSTQAGGYAYQGMTTYHQTVREPCAVEQPPWPKPYRTIVDVQQGASPATMHTSPVASITCPTVPHTLTITLSGTGSGQVTSSPAGIDCPGTCASAYPAGTKVTLTATPAAGSRFQSWTGEFCGGQGTCEINLIQDMSVGADFESTTPP